MVDSYPQSDEADITLVLEGTYPFVIGGVSNWLEQLLKNLSQYRFAIIFLGGKQSNYDHFRYTLPRNVVHLEAHYLFDNELGNDNNFYENKDKENFLQLQ